MEFWKECEDHKGYLVSNLGRVYSVKRTITRSDGRKKTIGDKILAQFVSHRGYLITRMDKKTLSVHRLVAKAFKDNPNNFSEVNHIDGNKTNNHVDNLEWVSRSENMKHAAKNDLLKKVDVKGTKNAMSKLNEAKVIEIRKLYKTGKYSMHELGNKYRVRWTTIQKVINRENWKHI